MLRVVCSGSIAAAIYPPSCSSRRGGTTLLPSFRPNLYRGAQGHDACARFPSTLSCPQGPQRMLDQQDPAARPTFVQIRPPASAGRIWRKIEIGLGGLAFVVALGLAVFLPVSSERATMLESEAPARLAGEMDQYPEAGTPMPELAALPSTALSEAASTAALSPAEAPSPAAESSIETAVRLEKGDTVARVLNRLGVAAEDVADSVAALAAHVRMERLPIGQIMTVTLRPADEAGARPVLLALSIRPEPRREYTLERDDDGDYSVEEEVFAVASKLQRASGAVDGSVIASAEAAGVPRGPLAEMLRAFSWDVNFQHDIKVGDRFDILIERSWTSDGLAVDDGRVLWAELTTGGGAESFSVYRFKPRDGEDFFYNGEGESVVKALLRTPLNMSRISSRFGMRHHPVLRFTRLHAGVDFAAPPGTPILAAGDGRVVEAGPNGGYGRWVKISHAGGLATGYAHMSRIAPGVRRSARVRQGQVIGFVGSSGLSTGPHLHFELHRAGRPVDPLSMARTALRARLRGKDLERFKVQVAETDRARQTATTLETP
ncbi:MAG: peptidoglycan DD-metalloendopeptidase family protein [Acidobacteriota bacterium]